MAYPSAPNWMSSDAGSGWFIHRVGDRSSICSTTGWDTLADLQLELQSRLSSGSFTTYDGSAVDASSILPNDPTIQPIQAWNVALLKALYAIAQNANAPQDYLLAIQGDAQNGTGYGNAGSISAGTLQTGIWIGKGYYSGVVRGSGQTSYGVGSPAEVVIPIGTTYPSIDIPPPVPSTGVSSGAICNVAPTNIDTIVPVNQTVVPFQINLWLVLGVAAVTVGTVAVMAMNVPVTKTSRNTTRNNPSRRRRSKRSNKRK